MNNSGLAVGGGERVAPGRGELVGLQPGTGVPHPPSERAARGVLWHRSCCRSGSLA